MCMKPKRNKIVVFTNYNSIHFYQLNYDVEVIVLTGRTAVAG